ncbi:MAG: apolipoprotein N-acyltransferase [Salinisphaeraceae bacterium]|nr:apolipoprotein N-acyltransferase [Salinisphaeraceae bacterium]
MRHLAAAALLGALATLAFPPYGFYPAALLAVLGMAWLWYAQPPGRAALLGLVFGLGHYLTGIYWVFISTYGYGGAPLWMGILLTLLLSSYCAAHMALVGFLVSWRRIPSTLGWALVQLPAAWLLGELLRDWHQIWSFPWLSLGYAFTDSWFASFAPIMGVHGITYVAVLLGAALWLLLGANQQRLAGAVVSLVVITTLWLLPAPGEWTATNGKTLKVGLVQGNIPQERKWLPSERMPTLQLFRGMSLEIVRQHPDTELIIWPEAAIPLLYNDVKNNFMVDLHEWAAENDLTVLTGILNRVEAGIFNTMRAVGVNEGVYRKRHLVPFGEFFPVPDFMRAFMKGVNLDYEDLLHGELEQPLINVGDIPLGISICFEDAFGRDIRRDLPKAQLLVNVTNDAWFNDSSAPYQHLQIARMRAIETGRQLIRVSNRGVSALIEPDGELAEQTPMFKADYLVFTAQAYSGETPFSRWGDLPLRVLTVLLLLLAVVFGRKQTT